MQVSIFPSYVKFPDGQEQRVLWILGFDQKVTCHVGTQKENVQTGGPGEACPDELLPIASTALI